MTNHPGTQAGDSKPEVQKWIPVKRQARRVDDGFHRITQGERIQMIIRNFIKLGILKVLDENADELNAMEIVKDRELLKFLKGKTLVLASGREPTPVELGEMVNRELAEYRAGWQRVDGAGAQMGMVDRIGHGGSTNKTTQFLENDITWCGVPEDKIDRK